MEILDYNVIRNNNFDRTKSYFSCYYNSIVLFTDYDAKSYNFAVRYNDNTRNNELYVILYKDEVINLLDVRLRNKFVMSKNDFNVNVKFVEERDDNCIIYHIDID